MLWILPPYDELSGVAERALSLEHIHVLIDEGLLHPSMMVLREDGSLVHLGEDPILTRLFRLAKLRRSTELDQKYRLPPSRRASFIARGEDIFGGFHSSQIEAAEAQTQILDSSSVDPDADTNKEVLNLGETEVLNAVRQPSTRKGPSGKQASSKDHTLLTMSGIDTEFLDHSEINDDPIEGYDEFAFEPPLEIDPTRPTPLPEIEGLGLDRLNQGNRGSDRSPGKLVFPDLRDDEIKQVGVPKVQSKPKPKSSWKMAALKNLEAQQRAQEQRHGNQSQGNQSQGEQRYSDRKHSERRHAEQPSKPLILVPPKGLHAAKDPFALGVPALCGLLGGVLMALFLFVSMVLGVPWAGPALPGSALGTMGYVMLGLCWTGWGGLLGMGMSWIEWLTEKEPRGPRSFLWWHWLYCIVVGLFSMVLFPNAALAHAAGGMKSEAATFLQALLFLVLGGVVVVIRRYTASRDLLPDEDVPAMRPLVPLASGILVIGLTGTLFMGGTPEATVNPREDSPLLIHQTMLSYDTSESNRVNPVISGVIENTLGHDVPWWELEIDLLDAYDKVLATGRVLNGLALVEEWMEKPEAMSPEQTAFVQKRMAALEPGELRRFSFVFKHVNVRPANWKVRSLVLQPPMMHDEGAVTNDILTE